MKKVVLLIIVLGIGLYYLNSESEKTIEDPTETESKKSKSLDWKVTKVSKPSADKVKALPTKPSTEKKTKIPPFVPKNKDEKSLKELMVTFDEVVDEQKSSKELREELIKLNLKPTTAYSKNPYTGGMNIVRTKLSLPGTRYIHAQYMSDANGNEGLQHLSFEYRKGPNALERATMAVKSIFGIEGEPSYKKGDFVSFKLTENYIIWLKEMKYSDLKDDPFNAYTKEDEGTIRVAIELEIHGDDHNEDEHVEPESE